MPEVQPPRYLNGGCYTVQDDRQIWSSVVCDQGVALGACPTGALEVTDSSSGGLNVEVQPGSAFIEGETIACQGMYHVTSDSAVTLTLEPADPTDTRVDLIVATVHDSQYSGAEDSWELQVISGIPGGGAPAEPSNSLALAEVTVAGGATEIASGDITDRRNGYKLCADADAQMIVFDVAGTYTFNKGDYPQARSFKVTVIGGGAGGGGAPSGASGDSSSSWSGGGGAGGHAISILDRSQLGDSETVIVGAGGAGGVGAGGENGSVGEDSTFAGMTGSGGNPGNGAPGAGTALNLVRGGLRQPGSGGQINGFGGAGDYGIRLNGSQGHSGNGGDSFYNTGGKGSEATSHGANGQLGSGGAGGASRDPDGTRSGGDGGDGIVVIEIM